MSSATWHPQSIDFTFCSCCPCTRQELCLHLIVSATSPPSTVYHGLLQVCVQYNSKFESLSEPIGEIIICFTQVQNCGILHCSTKFRNCSYVGEPTKYATPSGRYLWRIDQDFGCLLKLQFNSKSLKAVP